jgi:hypothetical protein
LILIIILSLDFALIDKILAKAEKKKQIKEKKSASSRNCSNSSSKITLTLPEVVEAYRKIMSKRGIDINNETHYYALIIKLSLNQ